MFLSCHVRVLRVNLAKWLSVRLRTEWFWVRVQLQSKWKKFNIELVCLAITGGIQGTYRERLYDELGLVKRRWYNKLVFFHKIVNRLLPDYLYSDLDFPSQESYLLRSSSASIIRPLPMRTKSFKKHFIHIV